jgi:hypothetical protein
MAPMTSAMKMGSELYQNLLISKANLKYANGERLVENRACIGTGTEYIGMKLTIVKSRRRGDNAHRSGGTTPIRHSACVTF